MRLWHRTFIADSWFSIEPLPAAYTHPGAEHLRSCGGVSSKSLDHAQLGPYLSDVDLPRAIAGLRDEAEKIGGTRGQYLSGLAVCLDVMWDLAMETIGKGDPVPSRVQSKPLQASRLSPRSPKQSVPALPIAGSRPGPVPLSPRSPLAAVDTWRSGRVIPMASVKAIGAAVICSFRRSSAKNLEPHLPPALARVPRANIDFLPIKDAWFSGSMNYIGRARNADGTPQYEATYEINASLQISYPEFEQLVSHEVVPGHVTTFAYLQDLSVRGLAGFEATILTMNTRAATLFEGIANNAILIAHGVTEIEQLPDEDLQIGVLLALLQDDAKNQSSYLTWGGARPGGSGRHASPGFPGYRRARRQAIRGLGTPSTAGTHVPSRISRGTEKSRSFGAHILPIEFSPQYSDAMDWSTSSRWIRLCHPKTDLNPGPRFLPGKRKNKMGSMAIPGTLPTLKYADLDGEHCFPLATESVSIGRSPDQDLVSAEAFVSRRHAIITRTNGSYELVDQNSSHGTFVNGVRVQRAILKSGDTLQFGSLNSATSTSICPRKAPTLHPPHSQTNSFPPSRYSHPLTKISVNLPAKSRSSISFLMPHASSTPAEPSPTSSSSAPALDSTHWRGARLCLSSRRGRNASRPRPPRRRQHCRGRLNRLAPRHAEVHRSHSKFFLSDTLADDSAAGWASVMANSIRSIYCIPLRKHISPAEPNRLLGLLYLDSQISPGSLSEIDHQVLDTLATEASTLLHNALLADTELKARHAAEELAIAASIHSSLMSITMPKLSLCGASRKQRPMFAILAAISTTHSPLKTACVL